MPDPGPLSGRVALITGVSRRIGIAHAVTDRLLADGASVLATGWHAFDEEAYGAGPADTGFDGSDRVRYVAADLADPDAPAQLVDATIQAWGAIDIVVAVHARSINAGLRSVTAQEIDLHFAVNTRATILLAQALSLRHDDSRPGGRFILFTSGQHLGPIADEIAYVASKGANQQITASLADAVAAQGITVNCVNPGPVDTGYATGETHARVAAMFPAGRWGTPEDTARLVAWLVSDEAAWITGQVINSEGGFRRA
jgi:3-oxoacyl-[acyl-carrier protein] reductase